MKKTIITSDDITRFSNELCIFNEIIFDLEEKKLLNSVLDLENINSIIENVSK